jgi:hypothetical protein
MKFCTVKPNDDALWKWILTDYFRKINISVTLVWPFLLLNVSFHKDFSSMKWGGGIATGHGWTAGVRLPTLARNYSTPQCPDRPWGSHSLLSNGHWVLFPRG